VTIGTRKISGESFCFLVLREMSVFILEEAKKKLLSIVSFVFSREREEKTRSRSFTTFRAFFDRLPRCLVFFSLGRVEATRLDRCLNFSFFFSFFLF
jgi:hypothetical protein